MHSLVNEVDVVYFVAYGYFPFKYRIMGIKAPYKA